MSDKVRISKLDRRTIAFLSFLFGLGVLVAGAGLVVPAAIRLAFANPQKVIAASLLGGLVLAIQLLGKPLGDLLKRAEK